VALFADRFLVDAHEHAIDLATGASITLVMSPQGGATEQRAWVERCEWFASIANPWLAPLVDYGLLGDTQRFEAWRAKPGWRGATAAAQRAVRVANAVLQGHGRWSLDPQEPRIGSIGGRAVVVPDSRAGLPAARQDAATSSSDRSALAVVRSVDPRVSVISEILHGGESDRVSALGVWAPEGGALPDAVVAIARSARLAGYVPVSTRVLSSSLRATLSGRSVLLLAHDDVEGGWRGLLDLAMDSVRPHVVLFVGGQRVTRVHTLNLSRTTVELLAASASPPTLAKVHLRHVNTAARRAGGLTGRFQRLLFGGDMADGQGVVAHQRRLRTAVAAESGQGGEMTTGEAVAPAMGPDRHRWPAPGELGRLRGQLVSARALLASGRFRPCERLARQAMHAFARRSEWASAAEGALLVAQSLAARGRMVDAATVIEAARPWGTQGHDLRLLQALALLKAHIALERGRLAEAELLLESTVASASSAGTGLELDAVLAQVRCLYWQGRFADAWHRLGAVAPGNGAVHRDQVRVWTARSRVSIGRGRLADAVADAARARDGALALQDASLLGPAWYASALALLAAGDAAQAEVAAVQAATAARRAHDPMLGLCVRLLRADVARRQDLRSIGTRVVRRLARVPASALPHTVRARIDLLRDLLVASDAPDAAERRADLSGLPALRLFAETQAAGSVAHSAPAADDIVDLLRCCQVAEEDEAVLTAVCVHLRTRLRASGVAFFATDGDHVVAVAGDGARVDGATARRVRLANQLVLPHHGGDRVEGGVPVRYGGQVVGVLAASWTPVAAWQGVDLAVLLSTGATAAGPAFSSLLARRAAARAPRTSDMLGVSRAVALVRDAIERAATAPFAVLVEGESGSGKELAARMLHRLGPRRDRPFCTLNCAALPDDLVESELFGHARGAFTGAVGERRGVFEDAHSGTLFLDEIGELSPRAQAKLLRAIQEGEIRRVGDNVCRRVDVRLVTATNRDLRVEAAAGRFRADLLYRLDVIRIVLPPLRERRDDIPILVEHVWRDAAARVGSRATLSTAAVAALTRYDWPGNVRELQNVLAALAVRCPKRGVIPVSALPASFVVEAPSESLRLETARRTFDRAFVRAALVRAGGQRTRAAAELGVTRQGLAKLLARLDIDSEAAG
jgi:DNA-binding NtrC family response regulator